MRVAITGSRGFLGGSFGRHSSAAGHEVLGISRASQPDEGWPGEHAHADCLHSDLANIFRAWRPDCVLHAAGSASVADSLADPLEDLRASAMTLANVVDGLRRAAVSPVLLFPSSAAVYGNPARLPVAEAAPLAPISPYGFHKAACELLSREAAEVHGLRVVVARLFSVYGPRQRRLLAWELYRQLSGPAPVVELQGTGNETRDFLHIDDVCSALLAMAGTARQTCAVVNLASGLETPIARLFDEMRHALDSGKMLMCRGVARPGDPARWQADTTRLREFAPGWQARPLRQGIVETLAHWQTHG